MSTGATGLSRYGRKRPRLCENSDLSVGRENPTAQNGPQSTIGISGDILQLPKTRAVGVFTQPRPRAAGRLSPYRTSTVRTVNSPVRRSPALEPILNSAHRGLIERK